MSEIGSEGPLFQFLDAHVRATDPKTSRDAAKQVNVKSVRALILLALRDFPEGMASFELSTLMLVPRDYISPHLKPLSRLGLVTKTGLTRLNPQTSNRTKCEVWRLTDKGRRQILEMNISIRELRIKRLKELDHAIENLEKERSTLREVI